MKYTGWFQNDFTAHGQVGAAMVILLVPMQALIALDVTVILTPPRTFPW
jgi:hypothetical protein